MSQQFRYESRGPNVVTGTDPRPYDAFNPISTGYSPGIDQYDISDMYGQPRFPYQPDPMANVGISNNPLPDAFRGERSEIRVIIEDKISQVDLPVTTYILPLKKVQNPRDHEWDKLIFDQYSLDPVPEESAPQLVQSRYTKEKAYLERFGLGMKMEHGFMRTVEGRREYAGKLQQIISGTQRFIELRGLAALCNAKNYAFQFQLKNGSSTSGRREELTFHSVISDEIMNFGALQKEPNALARIVQYGKNIMSSYGIKPNFILIPESVEMYASHARPELLNMIFSGPNGNQLLSKSQTVNVLPGTGLMVLITRPLNTRPDTPTTELLKRYRTVGSFTVQIDRYRNEKGYKSSHRIIYRYDETNDQEQKLTLSDIVLYTRRFDQLGKLHSAHGSLAMSLNNQGEDAPARVVNTDSFYDRGSRGADGYFKSSDDYNDYQDIFKPEQRGAPLHSSLVSLDVGNQSRAVPANKLRDMFLYWTPDIHGAADGSDGRYRVCDFIGDMEIAYLSHRDTLMAGHSIAEQLNLSKEQLRDFNDGLALMQEIDSTQPNEEWFKRLADNYLPDATIGNLAVLDSTKTNPVYLVPKLPKSEATTLPLPFGYANYRGMRYLAVYKSDPATDGWNPEIFVRARKFMTVYDQVFNRLRAVLGESPYFRPDLNFAFNGKPFDSEMENSKSTLFDHLFRSFGGAIWFPIAQSKSSGSGHKGLAGSSKASASAVETKRQALYTDLTKVIGSKIDDWPTAVTKTHAHIASLIKDPEAKGGSERAIQAHKENVKELVGLIAEQYRARSGGDSVYAYWHEWFGDILLMNSGEREQPFAIKLFDANDTKTQLDAKTGTDALRAFLAYVSKPSFKPAGLQAPDPTADVVDAISTLTHPSTMRSLNANNRAFLTDLSSVKLLKPLKAGDQKDEGTRFGGSNPPYAPQPLRDMAYTGMRLTSARSPEHTALHSTFVTDAVADKYRAASSASSAGSSHELAFPHSSGYRAASTALGVDSSSKRAKTADTGARMQFSVPSLDDRGMEDDEKDAYPFWTAEDSKAEKPSSSAGAGLLTSTVVLGGSVFKSSNMRSRFRTVESEPDDLVRACAHIYISMPIRAQIFHTMIENDIRVPFNAIWWTPSVKRRMDSAIMGVTGDTTGATLWGHSVFEIGDDSRIGVHFGSYTVYTQSVIYDERKIMTIRDLSFVGYIGGAGPTFITNPEQYVPSGDHTGDIIGTMVPLTQDRFSNRMDITGRWQQSAIGAELYSRMTGNDKDHYASAPYYNQLYQGFYTRQDPQASGPFFSPYDKINTVCIQDFQREFDKHANNFDKVIENQGHAGATFQGCAKFRNGAPLVLPLHSWSRSDRRVQLVP